MKRRNVAILLFNDVEVLDFAGPFEVFSVADELNSYTLFNVFTVAETNDAIIARNGLSVNPDYTILNCPKVDILNYSRWQWYSSNIREKECSRVGSTNIKGYRISSIHLHWGTSSS